MIAAISKVFHFKQFVTILQKFTFLSGSSLLLSAILVIDLELMITFMLLISRFRKKGILLAIFSLLGFTVFQVYLIWAGQHGSCGCFIGVYEKDLSISGISFNLVLLIICSLLLIMEVKHKRVTLVGNEGLIESEKS